MRAGSSPGAKLPIPTHVEAAAQLWQPLGRLLVEKGVISAAELDAALDEQERTGQLLGELLVALGIASRPAVVDALAEQAGSPLEHDRGFGTGLRVEIDRRHRELRGRVLAASREAESETDEAAPRDLAGELDVLLEELATASAFVDHVRGEIEDIEAKLSSPEPRPPARSESAGGSEPTELDEALRRAVAYLASRRAAIRSA